MVGVAAFASDMLAEREPNTAQATTPVILPDGDGEDRRCVGCHHGSERHIPALAALRITPATCGDELTIGQGMTITHSLTDRPVSVRGLRGQATEGLLYTDHGLLKCLSGYGH